MRAPTASTPPAAIPATSVTAEAGRLPMRPVEMNPTPSQLSRAERATTHAGVASRGWRFRWRDEPDEGPGA